MYLFIMLHAFVIFNTMARILRCFALVLEMFEFSSFYGGEFCYMLLTSIPYTLHNA